MTRQRLARTYQAPSPSNRVDANKWSAAFAAVDNSGAVWREAFSSSWRIVVNRSRPTAQRVVTLSQQLWSQMASCRTR